MTGHVLTRPWADTAGAAAIRVSVGGSTLPATPAPSKKRAHATSAADTSVSFAEEEQEEPPPKLKRLKSCGRLGLSLSLFVSSLGGGFRPLGDRYLAAEFS